MGFMAFMMWMSGSQIQIFSIMMTANGIYQPIAAIANSGQSKHAASMHDTTHEDSRLQDWIALCPKTPHRIENAAD